MKRSLPLIAVFVSSSILAIRPIFSSGYFPMHDDTQVARVITMGRSLSEGQFPFVWLLIWDSGTDIRFLIFMVRCRIIFRRYIICIWCTGIAGYQDNVCRRYHPAGNDLICSSFRYVGCSGRRCFIAALYLCPVSCRTNICPGSRGEYWILSFWPLILYALAGRAKAPLAYRRILIGGIGVAGAVLTHTLLGYNRVFLVAGLLVYWLIRIMKRTFAVSAFASHMSTVLFGLGLSALFGFLPCGKWDTPASPVR